MNGITLPPDSWHMAVLIPARDEQRLLPRCLQSVLHATKQLPHGVTTDVIVVADGCVDSTFQVAEDILRGCGIVLAENAGNVGQARALAARKALSRHRGQTARCWLANTDADCKVPETWLLDQLALAQQGYAAVAGIVDVDSFAEHLPVVESLFRLTYKIHPDGTHPHVHGANLGMRADAYLLAGGWSPLSTAEDHDLWRRLTSVALHLSDSRLQVLTSGRRVGRAPLGFAGALAKHNDNASEVAA